MTFGIVLVLLALIALILLGIPVAYAFGIAGFALSAVAGANSTFHLHQAMSQLGGFALLALPLFIIAGALMSEAGISDRLLLLVEGVTGRFKGGLGLVTIVTCGLFGAISGSAAAAIAAIGRVMIPRMVQSGYEPGYAVSLVACSSVLSLLIPPSIPMIVFSITSGISVSAAFLSTVLPGILLAVFYLILNYIDARHRERRSASSTDAMASAATQIVRSKNKRGVSKVEALFALCLPVLVLGGIYGGVFTPTEAAAVAVVYALLVGWTIFGTLSLRKTFVALREGVATTGQIAAVLFFLFVLTRALSLEQVPQGISLAILGISDSYFATILLLNLVLLAMGMLVDDISGSILAAVLLTPVATSAGIDPIHFAAIVGTNLGLGNVSPPCAPLLFMAGGVAKLPLVEYVGPAIRLLIFGHLPVVLIVSFVPQLALWLPNMLLG